MHSIIFVLASDELPTTELPVTVLSPVTSEDSTPLIGGVLGAISVLFTISIVLLIFIVWYNRRMARKNL